MISAKAKPLLLFFLGAVLLMAIAAALVFGGVLPRLHPPKYSSSDYGAAQFSYRIVDFPDLPGWHQDDLGPAFGAFLRSCAVFDGKDNDAAANPQEKIGSAQAGVSMGGTIADWREPCAEARALEGRSHTDADAKSGSLRSFFEFYFRPVQILSSRAPRPEGRARRSRPAIDETGVFTGYFEPAYEASRYQTARRPAPLYGRPIDLIEVDLGAFRENLKGERIAGRVEEGRLVPYPDHAAINDGAIAGKATPIAWLDATDLFFLQIQGSGQLILNREEAIRVNYAGTNGRPYTAIGRVMVERGMMPLEMVSMQTIRQWLENADPDAARKLREQNASYVFFRDLGRPEPGLGPPGAQGAALTPGRSLAVDRRYHTLGTPVWVDIDPVEGAGVSRIRRLMIAQDTGGAIKGPLRGDFFWGSGPAAGGVAGRMKARGRMYVLVPRAIANRLADRQTS